MGKQIKSILLLVAMEAEAAPIVAELGFTKDDPSAIAAPAPTVTFSGERQGTKIHLACNGEGQQAEFLALPEPNEGSLFKNLRKAPSTLQEEEGFLQKYTAAGRCRIHGVDNVGTVPAALTAYLAIQTFKPDLVISLGTAGGFKAKGGEIGDVYLSTGFANHDRHIPIPGFDKYGIWSQAAHPSSKLQKSLGIKAGVVSSSNNLGYSEQDMTQILENDASVKEMEGAAIAWAAHLFEVPVLALKSITDIVDGDRPPQEEFLENLQKAALALKNVLPEVLDFVAGKGIDDL